MSIMTPSIVPADKCRVRRGQVGERLHVVELPTRHLTGGDVVLRSRRGLDADGQLLDVVPRLHRRSLVDQQALIALEVADREVDDLGAIGGDGDLRQARCRSWSDRSARRRWRRSSRCGTSSSGRTWRRSSLAMSYSMPLLIVVGIDLCLGGAPEVRPRQAGHDAEHAGLHRLAISRRRPPRFVPLVRSRSKPLCCRSPHAVARRPTASRPAINRVVFMSGSPRLFTCGRRSRLRHGSPHDDPPCPP